MIKSEGKSLTMQGDPALLLVEVTRIIRALKLELEKQGVPEEEAEKMLLDAYMFAVIKLEDIAKLILTHDLREDIKWDEILN